MTTTVAVAGKGGTGKTTIAALLIELLASKGTVLAMDADPSVNLHMALGLPAPETIGDIREELGDSVRSGVLPPTMSKVEYFEMRTREAMVESTALDLVAMGRPEGPGCYCSANYALRTFLDRLADAYDYVVIDNEAGMEHISRQTTKDIHTLLLVSDPSIRGITAAGRMQELIRDLRTAVTRVYLVVNRINGDLSTEVKEAIRAQGLELLALVPSDPMVGDLDARGRPIVDLPAESPVREAVRQMSAKLGFTRTPGQEKAGAKSG
jgi:CO dehydrogenase maturation factor